MKKYEADVRSSWVWDELMRVRNFKPVRGPAAASFWSCLCWGFSQLVGACVEAWHAGMWPGLSYGGMTLMLSRGKDTCLRN